MGTASKEKVACDDHQHTKCVRPSQGSNCTHPLTQHTNTSRKERESHQQPNYRATTVTDRTQRAGVSSRQRGLGLFLKGGRLEDSIDPHMAPEYWTTWEDHLEYTHKHTCIANRDIMLSLATRRRTMAHVSAFTGCRVGGGMWPRYAAW